jgi:DHA2 family multidrug resistance protein
LSLFKSRNFAIGALALCLGYAAFFGNVVLMPLWMQSFLGYTATWAGLVAAPSGVTAILTSILASRLLRRYDPRAIAASAFALFATAYFMRAHLTTDSSFWVFVAPQLVQGLAMGLFFVSLLAVIFDGLPAAKVPAASGLSNFLRITAGSFAVSITTTFWDRREALHQSRLADTVTQYTAAMQQSLAQLHQLGLNDQTAAGAITQTLIGQSYFLSSMDLFYFSGWLCVALIPLCYLVPRPRGAPAAPAAAD